MTEKILSFFYYSSFSIQLIGCIRGFHGTHASQVLDPLNGVGPPTSATILRVLLSEARVNPVGSPDIVQLTTRHTESTTAGRVYDVGIPRLSPIVIVPIGALVGTGSGSATTVTVTVTGVPLARR